MVSCIFLLIPLFRRTYRSLLVRQDPELQEAIWLFGGKVVAKQSHHVSHSPPPFDDRTKDTSLSLVTKKSFETYL